MRIFLELKKIIIFKCICNEIYKYFFIKEKSMEKSKQTIANLINIYT